MDILGLDSRQETETCGHSWPRLSTGDKIKLTFSAGSHISRTVDLEGGTRSRTVTAEAKYDESEN